MRRARNSVQKLCATTTTPQRCTRPVELPIIFSRWKFSLRIFVFFSSFQKPSNLRRYKIVRTSHIVFSSELVSLLSCLRNIVSCALKYPSTYCMPFIVPPRQNRSPASACGTYHVHAMMVLF